MQIELTGNHVPFVAAVDRDTHRERLARGEGDSGVEASVHLVYLGIVNSWSRVNRRRVVQEEGA